MSTADRSGSNEGVFGLGVRGVEGLAGMLTPVAASAPAHAMSP